MSTLRQLISGVTTDALANENIRIVPGPSQVNLWATSVTVTDTISLFLGREEIMPAGTMNVSAAALGMVDIERDQLIFNAVIGGGAGRANLRLPIGTLTTSLIFLLTVDPIV